jgi:hypothetical protein
MGEVTGYLGRTFHVGRYLRAVQIAAQKEGFVVEHLYGRGDYPIPALTRRCPTPRANLYLSSGVHGDEPAGPLAILRMLRKRTLPEDMTLTILPLLNPRGMAASTRETPEGIDLNRDYRRLSSPEAAAHVHWLKERPRRFDLCLLLHEDWEAKGYYLYELNPDREQSLAPEMLEAVRGAIGVDDSPEIDGHPAVRGLIRPQDSGIRLPENVYPEARFLLEGWTRHSYTMEAPSNTPLAGRIAAHERAVLAAAEGIRTHGVWFEI